MVAATSWMLLVMDAGRTRHVDLIVRVCVRKRVLLYYFSGAVLKCVFSIYTHVQNDAYTIQNRHTDDHVTHCHV